MKIQTKYALICGLALTTLLTTQHTVKADTTNESQVTSSVVTQNVNNNDTSNDVINSSTSQADVSTQQLNVESQQSVQGATTQDVDTQSVDSTSNQASDTNKDLITPNGSEQATSTAVTDASAASSNVENINGVVVTHNDSPYTSLYTNEGTLIHNRALAANTPWLTDKKLSLNGSTYYRVATNEFANSNDVTMQYGSSADGVVRVKQSGAVNYERNESGFVRSGQPNFDANSSWKYSRTDNSNGLTYYLIGNNIWLNSDDATVAPAYQNPSGWLQIHNSQIQPSGGAVGYDLYNGVEGVKTYLVRRYFGLSNAHTIYDSSVIANVRSLQARKGLSVTGIVNLNTWKAMGFAEDSWYGLDSYVAPLQTGISSSRSDHIEAMINQARKYLGQTWISGAASSPDYGVDCSGLVTQALYASGIDSAPISNIQHAQPGNEWNSRNYWNDSRIPHINFNNRQRGDLIFFADPATGVVWHVGILLDANTMIESWPYAVQIHSIYGNRGTIVGVKRVFA